MTANLTLAVLAGVLVGGGVYLLLERGISRALIGLLLMANGCSVLLIMASGPVGRAPIVFLNDPAEMSDPLPQAMILTAIVITLGMTGFLLAMAHRSWQLARSDDIADDDEDVRIVRAAERDEVLHSEDHEVDPELGDVEPEVEVGNEDPPVGDEPAPATAGAHAGSGRDAAHDRTDDRDEHRGGDR